MRFCRNVSRRCVGSFARKHRQLKAVAWHGSFPCVSSLLGLSRLAHETGHSFGGNMAKPRKGKAKVKVTASGKRVSYGQAGRAKDGSRRVQPGTSKGDSYCARSLGIKKRLPKSKQNDPNTPNNLSRKRWKCKGAKSMRSK